MAEAQAPDPQPDEFLQNLEELFQGRYFYTINIQTTAHSRLFKKSNLRKCFVLGLLITVLYEALVLMKVAEPEFLLGTYDHDHNDDSSPAPAGGSKSAEEESSWVLGEDLRILRYPTNVEGHKAAGEDFDPRKEQFGRPSSFQYVAVIRAAQKKIEVMMMGEGESKKESQKDPRRTLTHADIRNMTAAQYNVRFLIRAGLMIVICLLAYFSFSLFLIAHDVLIRHLIMRNKHRLIAGMVRIRRQV